MIPPFSSTKEHIMTSNFRVADFPRIVISPTTTPPRPARDFARIRFYAVMAISYLGLIVAAVAV